MAKLQTLIKNLSEPEPAFSYYLIPSAIAPIGTETFRPTHDPEPVTVQAGSTSKALG